NEFVADNKPYGAVISYYLAPRPHPKTKKKSKKETISLDVLDGKGAIVRHLDGTVNDGINRVVWDLQTDPPDGLKAAQDSRAYYVFYPLHVDGPEAKPGTYTIRLRARGESLSVPFQVRLDPNVKVDAAELQAQYASLARLAALQEQGEKWLAQIKLRQKKEKKGHPDARLDAFANELRNGDGSQNAGYKHPAKVIDQIAYLRHIIATSFEAPTGVQMELIDRYASQLRALEPRARALLKSPAPRTTPHRSVSGR
ncbi:MAG: hypothetical protein ABI282_05125, partial [Candidatus Baltobacteraceae bacterium]